MTNFPQRLLLISLFGLLALIEPVVANADLLAAGARIVKIGNTRGANDPSFVVLTEGGSGPCSNGSWVYFYPSGASNPDMQQRAYAAALLALSTNMRVDIEAPSGSTSCVDAYFIAAYP